MPITLDRGSTWKGDVLHADLSADGTAMTIVIRPSPTQLPATGQLETLMTEELSGLQTWHHADGATVRRVHFKLSAADPMAILHLGRIIERLQWPMTSEVLAVTDDQRESTEEAPLLL